MKFGEIFWGEVNIDAIKEGGGYKLLQMQYKYPNVQLQYLPDLPF